MGFVGKEYKMSHDGFLSRTPRVSVVVPTYNTEHFIGAAVRSVLAAGEPEVEVLVVDDGSTDGSLAAARAVDDPRVIVIAIVGSGGPARPRNIGIGRARAPYVALLDSDDLVKPGRLGASIEALERHPQAGFAFGNFERIDVDGNVFENSITHAYPVFRGLRSEPAGEDWRLIPQGELARGLLHENFIGTSGVVVRRQLLTELGAFDESIVYGEDLDLWFRLAHHSAALYSPRVSHSYRDRPESLTYRANSRGARDRITVLQREKSRWSDPTARRQLDHLIASNFAGLGYEERLRQRRLRSMAMFASAFTACPEMRWLRGMLGSAIPLRVRSRYP
jgi:glycosyltransferase involved in cell wall biosynthesis